MSTNLKVTLGVLGAALAVLLLIVTVNLTEPKPPAGAEMVRADSHRLSTAADGKVTVVEFLDFECEACGAAYPGVEKLRAEYGDRITYVVRYFPIASHPNAFNAAHAAEAAARQGRFEQMYVKLFDNQSAWGHSQESRAPVFAEYAGDLGLDMAKYTADVTGAEVAERVKSDAADGVALGVQGTPTFFINGERFTERPSYEALKATIDKELSR
ncbi:thioredoxin domain-containing protein [Actinoplanes sp. NEAU-A12]|uniref:Thioredoxin domain-containing protein n=1 Tax=Actinoplanes sandaracinus TaxID=3045177 RepID=A0ABT6WY43_9ACTN|nr:thioredoxin domain-containing protein [Actinoplanes sandaracinus]MDI6104654.1 thioredoxin domain-containing protein [Actinoplanes sandaracinus]